MTTPSVMSRRSATAFRPLLFCVVSDLLLIFCESICENQVSGFIGPHPPPEPEVVVCGAFVTIAAVVVVVVVVPDVVTGLIGSVVGAFVVTGDLFSVVTIGDCVDVVTSETVVCGGKVKLSVVVSDVGFAVENVGDVVL